jgi:PEP-CTERM motif
MFTLFQRPQSRLAAGLFALTSVLLVTGLPARANPIVDTNTNDVHLIDESAFENIQGGILVVPITVGNDNVPNFSITIGTVNADFVTPVAGTDTKYDVVNQPGVGNGTFAGVGCDNQTLAPSNNPFANAGSNCTFNLFVSIGDADTTDKKLPVDDFGEWKILIVIPYTRADDPTIPFGSFLTVDVKVLDDGIPEPATGWLGASGLGLMAVAAWRRRLRGAQVLSQIVR